MKQNNNKKKLAVAFTVLGLLAISLVGVVYATTYLGTTTNTGNTVSATYITVEQSAYANSFDKAILFDTSNTAGTITYTPQAGQEGYAATRGTGEGAYDRITVPSVLMGTVDVTVRETDANDPYSFIITHSGDIIGTYYVGIAIGEGAEQYYPLSISASSGYTLTGQTAAAERVYHVSIYFAQSSGAAPTATPLNDVTFTFTAEATVTG